MTVRNVKFEATFRQEFRSFFEPDFQQPNVRYELRSRIKVQAELNLDKSKAHRISTTIEALFSTSESTNPEKQWSTFSYQETRICLFYSFKPKNTSTIYSLGYMNDLFGRAEDFRTSSYIAFDIIWENPFKHFRRNFKADRVAFLGKLSLCDKPFFISPILFVFCTPR